MYTIDTICICGAGTMGSGIAQVSAMCGKQVIQFDVNPEMLRKSRESIDHGLQIQVNRNRISAPEKKEVLDRIRFTADSKECIADLIIEAIIEQKEAKTNLFRELAALNSPQTIFATNTSSISVNAIAEQLPYPGRLVGMHFFNPAPVMKLVEIVKATQTEDAVVETIADLCKAMGKIPVVCKDAPGFIVNRVARPYYLEAMQLVSSGLATIETVDAVMESTGFKMGPFKLMDLIGLDINYSVSGIVWEALGNPIRLTPSPLQKNKVAAGELGKKTGKGFYTY